MRKTFTLFITFLMLCFGCARPNYFQFSEGTGSFAASTKVKPANNLTSAAYLAPEGALVDSVIYTASTETLPVEITPRAPRAVVMPPATGVEYYKQKEKKEVKRLPLIMPVQKLLVKKSLKTLADIGQKPTHKLAKISLALAIGSFMVLFLSLLLPNLIGALSVIMLLSAIGAIVTGKIALNDIKANPEKYAGKGKALAGFVIGLVVSALFILFLIFALIFFAIFINGFT